MQCNLTYGSLKCALPEDKIDVDLKVHTLKGYLRRTTNPKPPNVVCAEQKCNPTLPKEKDGRIYAQKTNNNHPLC